MRRLFRLSGYVIAGLMVLGWLLPDASVAPASSTSVVEKPVQITTLPNDPDKEALFETLPQPAAVRSGRPAVATAPTYVYVTGSRVNVRASPDISARRLGAFDRGSKLVALEQGTGWTRVSGNIGGTPTVGWMSSTYLGPSAPTPVAVPAPKPQRSVAVPSGPDIAAAQRAIIRQSIAAYPGTCACEYNTDRAGRRCGRRSAWSKPGGHSPICYPSDVTRSHLAAYFRRQGLQFP